MTGKGYASIADGCRNTSEVHKQSLRINVLIWAFLFQGRCTKIKRSGQFREERMSRSGRLGLNDTNRTGKR